MCNTKAILAPVAVLHLSIPTWFGPHLFHREEGCCCPTYLVSSKTNKKYLALDILLILIIVTTPYPGWRPGEMVSWKICFPNSFIVSSWIENQVALWKISVQLPFLFLGVHRCGTSSLTAFLVTKTHTGGRCDHRWFYSSSLAPFPLAKIEKALQVGRVQASQSLNVHPNAFVSFQNYFYCILPNLGDAKREIWTCFQTLELQ